MDLDASLAVWAPARAAAVWCNWEYCRASKEGKRHSWGLAGSELSVVECVVQETAINIGFACSLLRTDMAQYIVSAASAEVLPHCLNMKAIHSPEQHLAQHRRRSHVLLWLQGFPAQLCFFGTA